MDDVGVCVSFSDDDLAEETLKWQHSLVMYVIGAEHTLSYMEIFVEKAWSELACISNFTSIRQWLFHSSF